jgi:hypothetical protein
VLTGAGQTFDFTILPDDRASSLEAIDITGSGNNRLVLGGDDVRGLSDTGNFEFTVAGSHNNLVIKGNAGDQISLPDWDPDGAGGAGAAVWQLVDSSVGLDGASGGGYNVYDLVRGGSTLASIAIDTDITKI